MVLQRAWSAAVSATVLGVTVLVSSGFAAAQQYRPNEFLTLDLSKAVLSPKPLGPATGFKSGPLDVTVDHGNNAAQANAELMVDPKSVLAVTVHPESKSAASVEPANNTTAPPASVGARVAHARAERPAAHKPRALVALHGRNPVEAQARDTSIQRDTRIQTWPCRSGGICSWKR